MSKNFRLGGLRDSNAVIGVPNQGLGKYAQARLDNTISRAVRRHLEALRVDGVKLYIWQKQMAGVVCTCRQPQKPLTAELLPPLLDNADSERQPYRELSQAAAADNTEEGLSFTVRHLRGRTELWQQEGAIPPEFIGLETADNPQSLGDADLPGDQLNSLSPLDSEITDVSDEELARLLAEGGAVYGGDKTACGICFGTGRTHGYELFSGKRIVLDASGETAVSIAGNAQIIRSQFPAQFEVDSRPGSAIIWTVDLPAYTDGWLALRIRNNLLPARNLQLEWFRNNAWEPLTLQALNNSDGQDRRASQIRVRPTGSTDIGEDIPFTHVELIFASMPPPLAQMPQISQQLNYDAFQPVINAEFELAGGVNDIGRESVFIDSKYNYAWKVTDTTQKATASGQVFGYTINARTVHPSEMLYALRFTSTEFTARPYRGPERSQGGIVEQYWPESIDEPNHFVLPAYNGASYDSGEEEGH